MHSGKEGMKEGKRDIQGKQRRNYGRVERDKFASHTVLLGFMGFFHRPVF
jgi:hypothetical protein